MPHLSLHIEILGAAPDCHLRKLAVRQNQILRTILGIGYIDFIPTVRTGEMYKNLKVLTVKNLFNPFMPTRRFQRHLFFIHGI